MLCLAARNPLIDLQWFILYTFCPKVMPSRHGSWAFYWKPARPWYDIPNAPAATGRGLDDQPRAFAANEWGSSWRNGVYSFHHYHSTAHEVLGIYAGTAQVKFGGPSGIALTVTPGDIVIIPAGVAHKNLGASGDFRCVGGYPLGQQWDMNYGKSGENIAAVAVAGTDPVYGADGPLADHWLAK